MSMQPTAGRNLTADVLRAQFAPEATDTELEHFALVCRHLDLDPYADQVCLVPRKSKVRQGNRDVWVTHHRPQITVAGRRAIAGRTGRLRGIAGPVWCGPRQVLNNGTKVPLEWVDVWDEDGPPYAARCLVDVDGWTAPANGTAKWAEFAQTTPAWSAMPSHMLGKVAEAMALRRAFPEVEAAVGYVEPRGLDADDAALMGEVEATAAPLASTSPMGSAPASSSSGRAEDTAPSARPPVELVDERRGLCIAHRPVPHLAGPSCEDWAPLGTPRCPDCGALGETAGHMECPTPQDHDEAETRLDAAIADERWPDEQ